MTSFPSHLPGAPASGSDEAGTSVHTLALPELHDGGATAAQVLGAASSNPLHQIKTQLQVCIGDIHLTVGELMAAREHQVLVLDRLVTQPVDVLLEGQVVARGELVAVGDQFAVRITELPLPLQP
jgi:flagellar motor switch protein FliN